MKVRTRDTFVKDLRDIRDKDLLRRVRAAIEALKRAQDLGDVANVKKMEGSERYYRLRIGNYRLGLSLEGDSVFLVRFLHRKDIYRCFP